MQQSAIRGWYVIGHSRDSKAGRGVRRASTWMAIIGILAPVYGLGAGAGLLKTLFRSGMNDVARKIAELPERYSDVHVHGLDFSPDGRQLAVNSDGEKLEIWNWQEGKVIRTLEAPRGFNWGESINPIQYSPDGHLLSVCDGKGVGHVVVRVWDTANWSVANDIVDTGRGGCSSAAFTPNGRLLLYVINRITSGELVAYATTTWKLAWRVQLDTAPEAVAMSPDGRFAAVSGLTDVVANAGTPGVSPSVRFEQTVDIVDIAKRRLIKTLHGNARGPIAWSSDSARVAVAGQLWVEMFDAHSGERIVHDRVSGSSNMNLRFTPDGRYLVESDTNGRDTGHGVSIWDIKHTTLLQTIRGDAASIAVSNDGKYLAIGGSGYTTIWRF